MPPDVQEFLTRWSSDVVSHDMGKVMAHYSEKYLNSGVTKGEAERTWKMVIDRVTSAEIAVTGLVPAGNRAYLAGFIRFGWGKEMMKGTAITNENGEWRWYGNQRDPPPPPPPFW